MKIYLENLPIGNLLGPDSQPGEFFPRLVGLVVRNANAVSSDGNHWADVSPIYIPLLRVYRQAGQILIEINSSRPLVYITLQKRRPFISTFRFPWHLIDSDEP